MDYLKAILNGDKDFYTLPKVRKVCVPRFAAINI